MAPQALDILSETEISYEEFARRLFERSPEQNLVPFLGAGASLGPPERAKDTESASPPRVVKSLDELFEKLDIQSKNSRSLVEFAVILAQHLDDDDLTVNPQMVDALLEAPYPPSANQLVRLFCTLLKYRSLSDVAAILKSRWANELEALDDAALTDILTHFAELTGIRRYTESLANVSSYYEATAGRSELWKLLQKVFHQKTTPTRTHKLVARSAEFYLSQKEGGPDLDEYVIVTTNYDCLMEYALDEAKVPYAVVTVDRRGLAHSQFSHGFEYLERKSPPVAAKNFFVKWPRLVIVYKIHGSLQADDDPKKENLIISESDYVRYIAQMGAATGVVPAYVAKLLKDKPFLFLAYSLNDWNVRAVFERIRDVRGRDKSDDPQSHIIDYSVLREVTTFERVYCRKNNVTILNTDLDSFVTGIEQALLPEEKK